MKTFEVRKCCTLRLSTFVLLQLILVACGSGSDSEQIVPNARQPPGVTVDSLPGPEEYLADKGLPPGQWRIENGARVCDGYMTRFADQDYCASEVPTDWTLFEFNGQLFYIQPLAGSDTR
jgi:hypothetical protein